MKHRGGKKKPWKSKGHTSVKKAYKEYVRAQLDSEKTNTATGQWIHANVIDLRERGICGYY